MNDNQMLNLLESYSDMVYRIALTYTKNIYDSEDICQNIFMKIFRCNKKFVDAQHEKAWIIRVTINECKDLLRSPWKKRISYDHLLPVKDKENKRVLSLVLTLPIKYRSVIYLYYFENYKTCEIGKLLRKRDSTIRTQLKRGRELLKRKMED